MSRLICSICDEVLCEVDDGLNYTISRCDRGKVYCLHCVSQKSRKKGKICFKCGRNIEDLYEKGNYNSDLIASGKPICHECFYRLHYRGEEKNYYNDINLDLY